MKQPKLGVSYLDLVYKPMLELFDLLKANDTVSAEASLAKAAELGWTVVSMKNDWNTVYGKLAD